MRQGCPVVSSAYKVAEQDQLQYTHNRDKQRAEHSSLCRHNATRIAVRGKIPYRSPKSSPLESATENMLLCLDRSSYLFGAKVSQHLAYGDDCSLGIYFLCQLLDLDSTSKMQPYNYTRQFSVFLCISAVFLLLLEIVVILIHHYLHKMGW